MGLPGGTDRLNGSARQALLLSRAPAFRSAAASRSPQQRKLKLAVRQAPRAGARPTVWMVVRALRTPAWRIPPGTGKQGNKGSETRSHWHVRYPWRPLHELWTLSWTRFYAD